MIHDDGDLDGMEEVQLSPWDPFKTQVSSQNDDVSIIISRAIVAHTSYHRIRVRQSGLPHEGVCCGIDMKSQSTYETIGQRMDRAGYIGTDCAATTFPIISIGP